MNLPHHRRIQWRILYRNHKMLLNLLATIAISMLIYCGAAFAIEHSAELQFRLSSREADLQVTLALLNGAAENHAAMYLDKEVLTVAPTTNQGE